MLEQGFVCLFTEYKKIKELISHYFVLMAPRLFHVETQECGEGLAVRDLREFCTCNRNVLSDLCRHLSRRDLAWLLQGLRNAREYDYLQRRMKNDGSEASPSKAVVSELQDLRSELRESASSYAARLDAEIERVCQAVETAGGNSSGAKIRDLRDMLTLLRHRQLKPDKGRRKDLKKIESVVNDLAMLIENW